MSLFVQKRAIAWAVIGIMAVAMLIVVINAVLQTRATQRTNVPKIDSTAETLKVVKDLAEKINSCTDPEGACARRGRAQTGAAVMDISSRQIAAVACADRPGTQTPLEIKACVERTLRVYDATHKPS